MYILNVIETFAHPRRKSMHFPDARTLLGQCSLKSRKVNSRAVKTDRKEHATANILVTCREAEDVLKKFLRRTFITGQNPYCSKLFSTLKPPQFTQENNSLQVSSPSSP